MEPNSSRPQGQGGSFWALEPQCAPWGQLRSTASIFVHSGDPLVSAHGCPALEKRTRNPEMPALFKESDTLMCYSALHKLVGCLFPTLNLHKPLVFQLWIPLFSFSSPLPHTSSPCAHTRIIATATSINLGSWTVYWTCCSALEKKSCPESHLTSLSWGFFPSSFNWFLWSVCWEGNQASKQHCCRTCLKGEHLNLMKDSLDTSDESVSAPH